MLSKVETLFKPIAITVFSVLCLFSSACESCYAEDEKPGETTKISYHKQILPILRTNCQGCHQPARAQGGYVMTSFKELLKGGDTEEKAIVPGHPEESFLIDEILPIKGKAAMPKNAPPLTEQEIKLIEKWIAEGAIDDSPEEIRQKFDKNNPPVYSRSPVITSLSYSPDGSTLAMSGFHEVLLVDVKTNKLKGRLIGLSEQIETVKFSPQGDRILVVGGSPGRVGEAQIWEVKTQKLITSITSGYDTLFGGSWSPSGKLVAFGSTDHGVRAYDSKTGKQVLYQGAHDDWALDTVFSPDEKHLISVGRDMSVKLIEVETERFVDNITSITPGALKGGVSSVDRHPTRGEIVIGGSDGVVKVYRIERITKRVIGDDANLVRLMPEMPGRIFDLEVSKDGKRIVAVSSLDGKGYVSVFSYEFDPTVSKELKAILSKQPRQWNANQRKVVDAYNKAGVKQIAKREIPLSSLYSVSINPNGKTLALGGTDGMVRVMDIEKLETVNEFSPAPVSKEVLANNSKSFHILTEQEANQQLSTSTNSDQPVKSNSIDQKLVEKITVEPGVVKIDQSFTSLQLLVTGIFKGWSEDRLNQGGNLSGR